jgi:hypothetical protein
VISADGMIEPTRSTWSLQQGTLGDQELRTDRIQQSILRHFNGKSMEAGRSVLKRFKHVVQCSSKGFPLRAIQEQFPARRVAFANQKD